MAYDETVEKNNTGHLFYNAVQPAGVMQFWNSDSFFIWSNQVMSAPLKNVNT
jgi:hypothetical protein